MLGHLRRICASSGGTRSCLHILLSCGVLLLFLIGTVGHAATTQYYYDDVGRIVQAIGSDGTIRQYQYDENGNVTAINRISGNALTVSGLSPTIGHVTASITIYGTGFSSVPSENNVRFGSIPAVVTGASTTRLVATVPQGAVTGPISVSVNGNSATSKTIFVVRTPSIASFSPSLVDPGTPVTVLGSDLNLIPGSTAFTVGGLSTTLNSATNKRAVFAAPNGSGLVGIDTPYGTASSAAPLTVIPSTITTANVLSFAPFLPGAPAQSITINQANKHVVLRLDATVGQVYSIHLSSMVVVPSYSSVQFAIYSPSNTVFHGGAFGSISDAWIQVPQIPVTGTYLVTITMPYSTTSVQMNAQLILQPELTGDGAPIDLTTTTPGEQRRYSFQATAGENFGLAMLSPTTSAWAVNFAVKTLNGTAVPGGGATCSPGTTPGCAVVLRNLPAGYYSIEFYPLFPQDATFSGTLRFSRSVTGSLLEGSNPVNISIPGQNAALTFAANGSEDISIRLHSVVTTPANKEVVLYLYNSIGSTHIESIAANSTVTLPELPAGTYTVVIAIASAATATMQINLARTPAVALAADGSTSAYSTSLPGQQRYYRFNATAGQSLGLALTNLVFSEPYASMGLYLRYPNGTEVPFGNCYWHFTPGCQISLRNLPATGVYTLRVVPGAQQMTMSFSLTLSQNVTGTLTPATALDVNLNVPGRQALITFTNTAAQNVALNLRSVTAVPSSHGVNLTVYDSNGTQIPGPSVLYTTTAATLNMPNLPAGTYSVLLAPDGAATATMQLAMATSNTTALVADGSPASFATTLPGQSHYFTFSASAGQSFGLAVTNLLFTPAGGNAYVLITQANNNSMEGGYGNCSAPGCQFNPRTLPTTGTYTVRIDPPAQATMSFALTLSQSVTGSLTASSPLPLSLSTQGQHALLTFEAIAGQTFALNVASISTQPAGKGVSVNVRYPNGSSLGTSSASGLTLNLRNLEAGTYSVLIVPPDATAASMQVLLVPGLTRTLTADGTTQSHAPTVPGQAAYFTFDATAGQNLGLAVTNLLVSPGTFARLMVLGPNNPYWGPCEVPRCSATERLFSLPTGTYTVIVDPESYATTSFDVTLSSSITGALTQGTPSNVNFAAPGQGAIMTFTAGAGQSLVLNMSSISMTPAGSPVRAEVYGPDGSFLNSTSTSLNFNNLAAGTYTIRMVPALGATGTLQLLVQ